MSNKNDDVIDLTLEDEESGVTNGIPYAAFLPIGVDVTDDVVHIDSDSENEQNLAEADFHAHFLQQQNQRQRTQQLQEQQQGKFAHRKAIQAATRKRKRKLAEEAAERKRRRAEYIAERKREAAQEAAEKKLRAAERMAQRRRQRAEEARERQRQDEQEARLTGRKPAPPEPVNFIIIDSDPEEDLRSSTSRSSSPPKKKKVDQRFRPVTKARKTCKSYSSDRKKKAPPTAAAAAASSGSSSDGPAPLKRTPQPYQNLGRHRVEWLRKSKTFNPVSDAYYDVSRHEAEADQDRLFREAAERMKRRQQDARDPSVLIPQSDSYGPTFSEIITNVHERFPLHWTWKDPYACLGLPRAASVAAAKAQYRSLVRCYHPDKSKQANTSNKFHAVVMAFNKVCQG